MCGLTGFWDSRAELSKQDTLEIVRDMSLEIENRGPDSQGVWCDESTGIALGHQRLSIVDLSSAGHQPMVSSSGWSILAYNGEIFNTAELRTELRAQGILFRSSSDTEVILEGCEHWGIEATCKRLIGMFAFAFWDRQTRELVLVRDRLGIKPLYWGFQGKTLFFGSQLRSFSKHPDWKPKIDFKAQQAYFRTNYIPAPMSIYENIHKLQPGYLLKINLQQQVQKTCFWDLKKIAPVYIDEPVEQVHQLLKDAVRRRMVADVPLGAFLSGGIDSSTIVALMQSQSTKPIKTFSIGFKQKAYDESEQASKIAQHLKTEHYAWRVSDREARDVIPLLSDIYDEPFGDASQIPTYLVSKMARQQVTVSLSGDGGDELFGGYNRYWVGHQYWPWAKRIPVAFRNLGALALKQYPTGRLSEKLYKFGYWLSARDEREFYQRSTYQWEEDASQMGGLDFDPHHFVKSMQQADLLTYLPDDILAKVDRASMAVSLEARVPFLDHRLVELAMSLPMELKIHRGKTKWVLRKILEQYIPNELTNQRKMGFGVPIDVWLRGSLRDWAEDLLKKQSLEESGLEIKKIRQKWCDHLSGRSNWQYPIWGVLMFQSWRKRWVL